MAPKVHFFFSLTSPFKLHSYTFLQVFSISNLITNFCICHSFHEYLYEYYNNSFKLHLHVQTKKLNYRKIMRDSLICLHHLVMNLHCWYYRMAGLVVVQICVYDPIDAWALINPAVTQLVPINNSRWMCSYICDSNIFFQIKWDASFHWKTSEHNIAMKYFKNFPDRN